VPVREKALRQRTWKPQEELTKASSGEHRSSAPGKEGHLTAEQANAKVSNGKQSRPRWSWI
jgi:hypothetical protein